MSELITSNYLKLEDLVEVLEDSTNIKHKLDHFGKQAKKKEFDPLRRGV